MSRKHVWVVAGVMLALGASLLAVGPAIADPPDPVTGAIGTGEATATTFNPDAGKRVEFQGSLV